MCGALVNNPNLTWTRQWPQEEGDYLWISQWSCGCVRDMGMCGVQECDEPEEDSSLIQYRNDEGKWLLLFWEGPKSFSRNATGYGRRPWKSGGHYDVTAFAKVDLPQGEEIEDRIDMPVGAIDGTPDDSVENLTVGEYRLPPSTN